MVDLERSYLRKREAYFRKNPLHDGHVRAWLQMPPTQRALFTCKCGCVVPNWHRPRDRSGHLMMHCGGVAHTPMTPEQAKDRKNERNRAARRRVCAAQGKEIRFYRKCDAHVKAWRKQHDGRKRDPRDHNAHVRLFRSPAVQWHLVDKHKEYVAPNRRKKRAQHAATLSDVHILRQLNLSHGLLKEHVPPVLIDVIREHARLKRALKQQEVSE